MQEVTSISLLNSQRDPTSNSTRLLDLTYPLSGTYEVKHTYVTKPSAYKWLQSYNDMLDVNDNSYLLPNYDVQSDANVTALANHLAASVPTFQTVRTVGAADFRALEITANADTIIRITSSTAKTIFERIDDITIANGATEYVYLKPRIDHYSFICIDEASCTSFVDLSNGERTNILVTDTDDAAPPAQLVHFGTPTTQLQLRVKPYNYPMYLDYHDWPDIHIILKKSPLNRIKSQVFLYSQDSSLEGIIATPFIRNIPYALTFQHVGAYLIPVCFAEALIVDGIQVLLPRLTEWFTQASQDAIQQAFTNAGVNINAANSDWGVDYHTIAFDQNRDIEWTQSDIQYLYKREYDADEKSDDFTITGTMTTNTSIMINVFLTTCEPHINTSYPYVIPFNFTATTAASHPSGQFIKKLAEDETMIIIQRASHPGVVIEPPDYGFFFQAV